MMMLLLLPALIGAVDQSKFRTCADTGFCRRHRTGMGGPPPPQYFVDRDSVGALPDGGAKMLLRSQGEVGAVPLSLLVLPHSGSDVIRLRLTDASVGAVPRWEAPDVLWRENEFKISPTVVDLGADELRLDLGGGRVAKISMGPFSLELLGGADQRVLARVNAKQLLHFEQQSKGAEVSVGMDGTAEEAAAVKKQCEDGKAWNGEECLDIAGYWEDGLARFADGSKEVKTYKTEETKSTLVVKGDSFAGHSDTQKDGPQSVGVDVDFPGAEALFGLPEHASSFALKPTLGEGAGYSEPYRFYNLDVFEYDLDVPMALYGAIPLVWAHSTTAGTVGAFWLNPSETFVDVEFTGDAKGVHWISETGVIDLFLIASKTPLGAIAAYARLTGPQQMPPLFALGYHQCRWNYKDQKDVSFVHGEFERLDIPYDVLWLDIEHTDGKRYFTWDKSLFPEPIEMQKNLSATGRKMVTIVDPHIKRDSNYPVHSEATKLNLYLKDATGQKDYEGWCWPGSSSYLDFTQRHVRQWWAERFLLENYKGSTEDLYTWNDMNEPSVFNGPEVTMPKDCQSLEGVEHRHWHNLYGMYFHQATAEGQELRDAAKNGRSFVLSRSFFAGSQRHGAIWTGDNRARWDHLEIASAMLLSINVAGLSFAGADAGGFFGDADAELMTRWIQAAAFTPFFRGHAHHDAKRREPWVYGEPHTSRLRMAIAQRYALLPYWYTVFAEARFSGLPVMRPLFAHYPTDAKALLLDDEWLVGEDLLVRPVTRKAETSASVYFPGVDLWYDVAETLAEPGRPKKTVIYKGGTRATVDAPIDKIPVFQRGGSIVPRQRRLRRSSVAMHTDPYELTVALSTQATATGTLYLDDAKSNDFLDKGLFATRRFEWTDGALSCRAAPSNTADFAVAAPNAGFAETLENTVERVVVLGLKEPPKSATLHFAPDEKQTLQFVWAEGVLTVRNPAAKITQDWTIHFTY